MWGEDAASSPHTGGPHHHDAAYVNVDGDTMTGPLNIHGGLEVYTETGGSRTVGFWRDNQPLMADEDHHPITKAYFDDNSDKTYLHVQEAPSKDWTVVHSLGKHPSVTVIDGGDAVVVGSVRFIDNDSLTISFDIELTGRVTCN